MSQKTILLLVLGFPITLYLFCGKLSLAIADYLGHLSARLWNLAFADSQEYKGCLESNLVLVLGFPICAPPLCLIALVSVAISLTCVVVRYPQRKSKLPRQKYRKESSQTVIHLAVQLFYIFRYIVTEIYEGLNELFPLNQPSFPPEIPPPIELEHLRVSGTGPAILESPISGRTIINEQRDEIKIELLSERRVNYKRLEDFLAAGDWENADLETEDTLLEIAERRVDRWLDIHSVRRLPCLDLLTIDRLWVHYSNGRFGLSVQQRIYQEVKGDYTQLCDRLGWSVSGQWLPSKKIVYSLQAPVGHLPWISWEIVGYSFLAQRFAICITSQGKG